MERNRIQDFLVDLAERDASSRLGFDAATPPAPPTPASSYVAIPQAIWAELAGDQRRQLMSMYQQAFLQAEAQLRTECVERLLESIGTQ
jgi:hypothetical protein